MRVKKIFDHINQIVLSLVLILVTFMMHSLYEASQQLSVMLCDTESHLSGSQEHAEEI